MVTPLLLERQSVDPTVTRLHEDDDPLKWPPWGCTIVALVPQVHRDTKLDSVALLRIFHGYDASITGGLRVATLKPFGEQANEVDKILVSTTVSRRTRSSP